MTYSEFKERAKQFFREQLSVTDYLFRIQRTGKAVLPRATECDGLHRCTCRQRQYPQ